MAWIPYTLDTYSWKNIYPVSYSTTYPDQVVSRISAVQIYVKVTATNSYSNEHRFVMTDAVGTRNIFFNYSPTGYSTWTKSAWCYLYQPVFPVKFSIETKIGYEWHVEYEKELDNIPYIDYYPPYDLIAKSFINSEQLWGLYLNFKWCANYEYDEEQDLWYIPDSKGRVGITNFLNASVYIYNSSGELIDSKLNISITAQFSQGDYRDILAIVADSEPADIATTNQDTILAIISPGKGAYYSNKLVYSNNYIHDPNTEGYMIKVQLKDIYSVLNTDMQDAIYYGKTVFDFGEPTEEQGANSNSVNFNVPLTIDTNWKYSVPMYINDVSLEEYIRQVKRGER